MCVSCHIRSAETDLSDSAQNLVVSADSRQIAMDYPLTWVTSMTVTTQAEPYGSPVFETSATVHPAMCLLTLGMGVYVAQARLGLESTGMTNCALIIPADGSAPFVRVYVKRPDFYV